jgi:hypothetical protein
MTMSGCRADRRKLSQPSRANAALQAEIRVENPLPDEPGDDEGQGEGIEHDGAERVFEPDLLIEQGRQGEADDEREDQRTDAVDGQVLDRDQPAAGRPEAFILIKATQLVLGSSGAGEGVDTVQIVPPTKTTNAVRSWAGGDLGAEIAKERVSGAAVALQAVLAVLTPWLSST